MEFFFCLVEKTFRCNEFIHFFLLFTINNLWSSRVLTEALVVEDEIFHPSLSSIAVHLIAHLSLIFYHFLLFTN